MYLISKNPIFSSIKPKKITERKIQKYLKSISYIKNYKLYGEKVFNSGILETKISENIKNEVNMKKEFEGSDEDEGEEEDDLEEFIDDALGG